MNLPWNTLKRQLESLYLLQVLTCVESQEAVEQQIEVEDVSDEITRTLYSAPATTQKTKRTLKKRTIRRYRVVPDLKAEALKMDEAAPAPDQSER